MTDEAATWIVVLNWYGRNDTLELLEQLVQEPVEIVIVDNGSCDGTIEAARARWPRTHRLQTGRNLGYAGGNNVGIRYALDHGAAIVGVLNNDTLIGSGFVAPLEKVLAEREAAVSPDVRYAANPDVSWFRGAVLDQRTGWPVLLPPERQPPCDVGPVRTEYLVGCCLFARAETWRRVGLFDERLFLIFEDYDWSYRATRAGVELLVVPDSRIEHKVSRSFTGSAAAVARYYGPRNGLVFAARYLGWRLTGRFLIRRLVRPAFRMVLRGDLRGAAITVAAITAATAGVRGPAGRMVSALAGSSAPGEGLPARPLGRRGAS